MTCIRLQVACVSGSRLVPCRFLAFVQLYGVTWPSCCGSVASSKRVWFPSGSLSVPRWYVDRLPVSLNESHYPLPLGERMVRLDLSGRDVIEVLEHDLGLRVSQARMEISAVPMPKLAAKWLQAMPDGPALQVGRVLLDDEGKPLQLETATHHADRFSYQLTMSR